MPLYVRDSEVDVLAEQLAALLHTTKTEAVRQALRNQLEREKSHRDLVAQSIAFAQALKERAGSRPRPADKAFIDGLYGDA